MAKQRLVNTRFWDDNYIIELDPIEKLLFLYLITNPLTNIAGIYEIKIKRMAFDTGIDKDMVEKILNRFEKDGKIKYLNDYVVLKNFIKNQNLNPSVISGIKREILSLPDYIKDSLSPDCIQTGTLNLTKLNLTKLISSSKKSTEKITYSDNTLQVAKILGVNPLPSLEKLLNTTYPAYSFRALAENIVAWCEEKNKKPSIQRLVKWANTNYEEGKLPKK